MRNITRIIFFALISLILATQLVALPVGALMNDDGTITQTPLLLISKIKTDAGKNQELVELYNPTDAPVMLAGWRMEKVTNSGKSTVIKLFSAEENAEIMPKQFYVLAHNQYLDVVPDAVFDKNDARGMLAQNENALRLMNGEDVSDAVGWNGSAYGMGTPAVDSGAMLQRCAHDGEIYNTQDNAMDFREYETAALRALPACEGDVPGADKPVDGEEPTDGENGKQGETDGSQDGKDNEETGQPDGGDTSGGDTGDTATPEEPEAPEEYECHFLQISEIAANTSEQFIELHNTASREISTRGCAVSTNRSQTKVHSLGDETVLAHGFVLIPINETELTLTKTTSGTVYLIENDNEIEVVSYQNLPPQSAFILDGDDWRVSYEPTPGHKNNYAPFLPCAEGYERSKETGRCRKIVEEIPNEPAPCEPGYERNPETNRCRKIVVLAAVIPCAEGYYRNPETGRCKKYEEEKPLAPCGPGQYRNPETGRCKAMATAASTLKPCAPDEIRNPETNRCNKINKTTNEKAPCQEGYERNPETGRCRKIVNTEVHKNVGFAPENVQDVAGATWGWWLAGGVGLVAVGYGAWQYHWEMRQLFRRRRTNDPRGKK